jgi:hypothetical protein
VGANGTGELTQTTQATTRVSRKPLGPGSFRSCKFRAQVIGSRMTAQGGLTFTLKIDPVDRPNATALQYTDAEYLEFSVKKAAPIADYKAQASTFMNPEDQANEDEFKELLARMAGS